jgi:hypothetical protein
MHPYMGINFYIFFIIILINFKKYIVVIIIIKKYIVLRSFELVKSLYKKSKCKYIQKLDDVIKETF